MTTGYEEIGSAGGGTSGQVIDPDGSNILSLADTTRAQQIKLNKPGFYEVYTAQGNYVVAVNADSRESKLQAISDETLQRWVAAMGGQPGSLRAEVRDSTWFANELKHVTDYFRGASRGRMETTWSVTTKLYTLSQNLGFYGDDDFEEERVVKMVRELIALSDDDIDFSRYDLVAVSSCASILSP